MERFQLFAFQNISLSSLSKQNFLSVYTVHIILPLFAQNKQNESMAVIAITQ